MTAIEFFYDVGSPYTYLAATRVNLLGDNSGLPVIWRPILLGGVFKATGNAPPAQVRPRGMYMLRDLGRWAERYDEPFRFPSRFPMNTLLAQRCLQALPREQRPDASLALMRAYWAHDRDLTDPQVLGELLGADLLERAVHPDNKDRLRAVTEEAVSRGVFGSPSIFVGREMFFGNDRLDFALDEAKRVAAREQG